MPRKNENAGAIILPALSGIIMALSFPVDEAGLISYWGWPAWFALVPFFISVENSKSCKSGFLKGYVFGTTLHLVSFYWLLNLPVPRSVSILAVTALTLFLSVYTGLFGAVSIYLTKKRNIPGYIVFPMIWICMEYIRGAGIIGFPWLDLAYTQTSDLPLLQFAAFTGHRGISLLVVLSNVVLARIVIYAQREHRLNRQLTVFLFLAFLFIHLVGLKLYNRQNENLVEGQHIIMVQGNLSPEEKWTGGNRRGKFEVFVRETRKAIENSKKKPDLIIWPETAVPAYLLDEYFYKRSMFTLAKEIDVPVLTGTLIAGHGEESKHYNGLVMFLPDGTLGGCYRKIQLVPFGEMIPLEDKIPLLARINLGQGDYSPGNELTVFRYKNQKISGVICFESMFPDLFRKFVKRGADFMVVVTNDAWYGRSGAPYHHAAISCMRAAENRVGLARCANTGVSCFIDPTGRLRHPTEIFTRETIEDDLFKVTDRPTFFSLHGDLLSRLILLLSLICIIMVSIKPELFRKTYRDNKIK